MNFGATLSGLETLVHRSNLATRASALVIALAMIAGVGLRVFRLDRVPPGLHPDEACDGYDAYSILTTGRDHHGNFLPLVFQGFNDYRMPLFDYSLVPLVAVFGLRPATVRLGAAIWGVADLAAITILGGLLLGWPGAAAAAVLGALSPWHLPLSRYGIEATAASATVCLAMVCFFLWLDRRRDRWLLLSGLLFGLSLYSYSITKAFAPLMIGLLGLLYWRELKRVAAKAFGSLAIVLLLAIPQVVFVLLHPAQMQARLRQTLIFNYMSRHNQYSSLAARLGNVGASWMSYFTPGYLFFTGDRGDHWTLIHPPGFGQLLPEQFPLIALALIALVGARHRKLGILLIGWLALAALPAALTVPSGIWQPEPGAAPTPWILLDHSLPNVPLIPSLVLAHPDSRHDVLSIAPWILVSSLGFVALLDFAARSVTLRTAAVSLLLIGVVFHGGRFLHSYFHTYPAVAAPYFHYGMERVVQAIQKLDDGHEPVVITDLINSPYIYVLFFVRYPPERFQRAPLLEWINHGARWFPNPGQGTTLFAPVLGFDHYAFVSPQRYYSAVEHGIFVFRGGDDLPTPAELSVRYPDGTVAYNVVVK